MNEIEAIRKAIEEVRRMSLMPNVIVIPWFPLRSIGALRRRITRQKHK